LLQVQDLSCTRGDVTLFRDLGFALDPGQCAHVQGPNGAGKTTLLRALCGLTRPAIGTVRWGDAEIASLGEEYHAQLLHIGHLNGLHGELSALENLRHDPCLDAPDTPDIHTALADFGLARRAQLPVKLLSQGQKRRVALARLVLAQRALWVLDEPFAALDRHATQHLGSVIERHLDHGGMLVVTAHHDLAFRAPGLINVPINQP
jgi:heme exporter protein A